jgi:polyketide biosynthesis acyl carrier protein
VTPHDTLTRNEVQMVVLTEISRLLPDVRPEQVDPSRSMAELGASSLDRMDVVVASQDALGIQVPAGEFAGVADIRGLVDVLFSHCGR